MCWSWETSKTCGANVPWGLGLENTGLSYHCRSHVCCWTHQHHILSVFLNTWLKFLQLNHQFQPCREEGGFWAFCCAVSILWGYCRGYTQIPTLTQRFCVFWMKTGIGHLCPKCGTGYALGPTQWYHHDSKAQQPFLKGFVLYLPYINTPPLHLHVSAHFNFCHM